MTGLDPMVLAADVARQRWYGANDQTIATAQFVDVEELDGALRWLLLDIGFASGEMATYQLVVEAGSGVDAALRPEVLRWMFPGLAVEEVRLLAGEQSNTSLVVDGTIIVKLFRRVGAPGERNPDVDMVRRLWDHGYRAVAEPIAEFRWHDRDLAVARRFLRGASNGWEMALDDPYFMDEARDLGAVTAQLHVALAEIYGAQPGRRRGGWNRCGLRLAGSRRLRVWTAALRSIGSRQLSDVGAAIRIHGDFHLGQVLHWHGSWYLLDFEGEPARPAVERTQPSSPLRDVAGMLRSFGYAAAVGGLPPAWESEARRRFLDGYHAVAPVAALLPADSGAVLAAFELDKAIYEVGYERASRPDWEHVPLSAVRRLLRP